MALCVVKTLAVTIMLRVQCDLGGRRHGFPPPWPMCKLCGKRVKSSLAWTGCLSASQHAVGDNQRIARVLVEELVRLGVSVFVPESQTTWLMPTMCVTPCSLVIDRIAEIDQEDIQSC